MSDSIQLCTFRVGGLFLGIAVERVQEVLRHQPMTRVPRAHGVVAGLMNLRGQIVTAIDLRRRLGIGPAQSDLEPMNVIVRNDGSIASFLVDEIADVVEVEADSFEQPPPTIAPETRGFVSGVYKLSDRLLLVLDAERVLSLEPSDAQAGLLGDQPEPRRLSAGSSEGLTASGARKKEETHHA